LKLFEQQLNAFFSDPFSFTYSYNIKFLRYDITSKLGSLKISLALSVSALTRSLVRKSFSPRTRKASKSGRAAE
jgi:hypothetical protein